MTVSFRGSITAILLALVVVADSCHRSSSRLDVDLSDIQIEPVIIHRYDRALFEIPHDSLIEGLEKIRPSFPFFLDTDLRDSSKISDLLNYLTNFRTLEFYQASLEKYSSVQWLERELTEALRHLRYYYPEAEIPRVYTYISGGEYRYPVRYVDSVLLIALDAYLGPGFKPYAADGLPLYRIQRTEPDFILPDCIRALAERYFPVRYAGNNLLDQMMEAGKRVYFVEALIPDYPDRLKIGYTVPQFQWIFTNEAAVWSSVVGNRFLYSSQGSTIRTFLADGPFTADFSSESPPRLGEYLGWQIIRGYMQHHPDISLQELLEESDSQKILAGSKYKPRK